MKLFVLRLFFILLSAAAAIAVSGVVTMLFITPLPEEIYELAEQGNRAATFRVALDAENSINLGNAIAWPVMGVTLYILDRWWRKRNPEQAARQASGIIRWLGAIAGGLFVSVWVKSVYGFLLITRLPEKVVSNPDQHARQITDFINSLDAADNANLWIWLLAAIAIGWWSSNRHTWSSVS